MLTYNGHIRLDPNHMVLARIAIRRIVRPGLVRFMPYDRIHCLIQKSMTQLDLYNGKPSCAGCKTVFNGDQDCAEVNASTELVKGKDVQALYISFVMHWEVPK